MFIKIAENENDSIAASRIYALSWKSGYKGIFSDELLDDIPLDFWVKAFNSNYETHRFQISVMNVDDEDIGAGGYGLSRDYDDSKIGEVTSIYFREHAWGKGYSKMLMDFMLDELRRKGCDKVHLWTVKDNIRAQRFYEKYGFIKTSKEKTITFRGETVIDIEYEIEGI